MNSVALPASATGTALGAEADLIRRAARGDGESFEELFRRHGQVAWRFAQSVAGDSDSAVHAVAEGFGRALRGLRRHNRTDTDGFRPYVLAAIYRASVDNLHAHGGPAPVAALGRSAGSAKAKGRTRDADAAFVEAAFRSLPERWRAAIWLSEVEAMGEDRIAPVLGVSAGVAAQLISRGRRGLVGRFEQGRRPVPAHLDSALRPLSAAVPASLGKSVGERWASLVNDPRARFAPINAWLTERAVRPLWVSVGGLMGLSLIGLGIVGESTGVNGGPVASGALSGNPNGLGINGPLSHGFVPIAGGSGLLGFNLPSAGGFGSGGFGSGGFGSGGPGGGSTSPGGGGPSVPPGGGGPGVPPGSGLPIQPPPLTPPPGAPAPTQLLPSNPVVSVSSTGSGSTTNYSVNLLPTSSGSSTGSVTYCGSGGVGLTVGSTAVGCTSSSPTTTTNNTSTTGTLSNTLSTTTSTLGGL